MFHQLSRFLPPTLYNRLTLHPFARNCGGKDQNMKTKNGFNMIPFGVQADRTFFFDFGIAWWTTRP